MKTDFTATSKSGIPGCNDLTHVCAKAQSKHSTYALHLFTVTIEVPTLLLFVNGAFVLCVGSSIQSFKFALVPLPNRLMLVQQFRPFLAAWVAATWHPPSPDPNRVDKAFKHDHMLPLIFVTIGSADNISGTRCVITFCPLACTSKHTHTLAVTDIRARVTLRKCAHSTHLQRGDPLRSTVLLLVHGDGSENADAVAATMWVCSSSSA